MRVSGTRGGQRVRGGGGGFTLVELLVVIAVVALLIGVLLPALVGARRSGQLVASMSNMKQITAGALAYTYDHDEKWPVVPVKGPPESSTVLFDSYLWGGKTSSDFWLTYAGGVSYHTVGERLLNTYLYPSVDLVDNGEREDQRLELDVYECPADMRSFQRTFWKNRPPDPIHPPVAMSSYDDVGTSYHMNMNWWYASRRVGESTLERWARTEPVFRRGGLGGPSLFVWLYDQTMDVVAVYGDTIEGEHGELNRSKAAYQDGHVDYIRVEPKASKTSEYWLLLE